MQFNAVIGNEVTYTLSQKIQNDIKKNQEVITQYNKASWERDRRNIQALTEFRSKVLDPDGNLEQAMMQAIAGWFGTESMYYDLDDVQMVVNAGGDPNSFAMTAGRLIHKVFKIEGLGNIWLLDPFSITGLDPLESYYLSAKVSRTALTGEWVLSSEQMGTESEPSYWHFNFGVLSSVIEGERSFKPTKGFTLISGGSIETDVISAYMINVNRLFAQVVTVGSDGYNNAGISGLADGKIYDDNWNIIGDDPNKSVRFWAGSDENEKHKAPFNVLNDGSMRAENGKIGNFNMDANKLYIGQKDTWQPFGKSVFLYGDYFLMRDNGAVAGQRREFSWNLYKNQIAVNEDNAVSIFNTMNNFDPLFPNTNVALELEASGSNENYALSINSGDIRVKGKKGYTGKITLANTASSTVYYHFNYINGLLVDYVSNGSATNPF
ncbi:MULTISPECIES: hypothetical protein [Sphingobacterium]|uniref:hypothetical protein n=1 Tax=Sphingobacterium TaxID=28453 RepID=UPI00257CE26F|nr:MULTISPECIES: hypothetical protein [Sphingobacterium]